MLLKRQQVEQRTGFRHSWIYEEVRAGNFPKPVRIGSKAVRWLDHEIDAWEAERAEARDTALTAQRDQADASLTSNSTKAVREAARAAPPNTKRGRPRLSTEERAANAQRRAAAKPAAAAKLKRPTSGRPRRAAAEPELAEA
jgi:prophage regulatory protein